MTEPKNIVERLLQPEPAGMCGESMGCNAASICLCGVIEDQREAMRKAADYITALERRLGEVEKALREIVLEAHETIPPDGKEAAFAAIDRIGRIASAALASDSREEG